MRVLIAADSILTLDLLLTEIIGRSWPKGTEAHVISVVEDDEVPAETWRTKGYGIAAVRHEMRRKGEQLSALTVERLRKVGISSNVTIMRGDPGYLIPYAARKWGADLIMIRSHNRIDFRNLMLGSVAKAVMEEAECSVEVVRPTGKRQIGEVKRNKRILVATDGSEASLKAVQSVAESVWPEGTEVRILSVVHWMRHFFDRIGFTRRSGWHIAHQAIGKAMKVLSGAPLKISGEVIVGRPARQIIQRAEEWDADLIVLGTTDRKSSQRVLFGNTAAMVARRAHRSVRIIRVQSDSVRERLTAGTGEWAPHTKTLYRLNETGEWHQAA